VQLTRVDHDFDDGPGLGLRMTRVDWVRVTFEGVSTEARLQDQSLQGATPEFTCLRAHIVLRDCASEETTCRGTGRCCDCHSPHYQRRLEQGPTSSTPPSPNSGAGVANVRIGHDTRLPPLRGAAKVRPELALIEAPAGHREGREAVLFGASEMRPGVATEQRICGRFLLLQKLPKCSLPIRG
jgi:hypothetical protein